jgi:hypothetical protein
LDILVQKLGILGSKFALKAANQTEVVRYMKVRVSKIFVGAIAGLLAATVHVQAVPTVYSLTQGNSALSPAYPSPYGSVSVDRTDSTHATVTFTFGSAGGFTYLFGGNGMADVNVNASSFTVSISTPGTTVKNGPVNNLSSFGGFNLSIDNKGGNSDAVNSVIFTLTDGSGTWADSASVLTANNDGFFVAAHIFVETAAGANPATGYAGDGGGRQVPDGGSTVALLGTGLLGLGCLNRLKAKKK